MNSYKEYRDTDTDNLNNNLDIVKYKNEIKRKINEKFGKVIKKDIILTFILNEDKIEIKIGSYIYNVDIDDIK